MKIYRREGVVAFAFGAPSSILSNEIIGDIAFRKAQTLDLSLVYTQRDIQFDQEHELTVTYTEEEHAPPPTLRIARGTIKWADRNGIGLLWVSAAKPHLWRCVRDLERAAREIGLEIKICPCEEIENIPEDYWFCKDSTQPRTHSQKNWKKREWVLGAIPFCLYKLVAS